MKINSTIAKFMAAGAILFGSVACTGDYIDSVSYTHLTLPTILLV